MGRIVHPNPIVEQAKTLAFAALVSGIAVIFRGQLGDHLVPALAAVWALAIVFCGVIFIRERFSSLEIGENDLLYKRGVLTTRTVLVQYSRITDTRYTQSVIERVFGVGTFEADTAGSDDISISIPSVRYSDVQDIIGIVRKKPQEGK